MAYDDELDDEELAELHRKAARNRTLALVGGVLIVGLVGLGLTARSCGGRRKDADRLTLRNAAARFEASPADEGVANALAAEYEARGKRAEADKVRERHAAAVASLAGGREKELRARVAAAPDDEQAVGQLVEVLGRKKDLPGAKVVYVAFVEKNPSPKRQASLGSWLWRNGFAEDAARALAAALKGAEDPYAHAYLGLALFDLDRKREARAEIERAQEGGAEMDLLNQRLYEIDQALGGVAEQPAPPPARPQKRPRPKAH